MLPSESSDSSPAAANTRDDCVLPPPPMPAEHLARYSPSRDPDSEQDIARYVEIEAPDETVQNVELVKTEIIDGEEYEIWDVVTDKERWWVISNLTNLYSHKHFPSLDYTISFHVGLMMRMRSRPSGPTGNDPSPFEEVFRRQEQAKHSFDRAKEPEHFQAVAVLLRECLLSLISGVRRRTQVPDDLVQPQAGNFVEWSNVLADVLAPGKSNKELRQFLKSNSRDTWQLVNWLVHDRDANKSAALIAIHSTDNVVGHMLQILDRNRTDFTEVCPVCGSRDVRSHFDAYLGEGGEYYSTCGACHWSDHSEVRESLKSVPPSA
jgi:hypothetical protein